MSATAASCRSWSFAKDVRAVGFMMGGTMIATTSSCQHIKFCAVGCRAIIM